MANKFNQLLLILKRYFGIFLSISLGAFIFVLFYQPFNLEPANLNDQLIYIAGIGAIVFVIMVLLSVLFFYLFPENRKESAAESILAFIHGFGLFLFSCLALTFYLRYVAGVQITFFLMIRLCIVCLAVPVILRIYELLAKLKGTNEQLRHEIKSLKIRLEKYKEDNRHVPVELMSDTGTDKINLHVSELAFIKSADNYVEIVYTESDSFKKKLLRNTMKGIEIQLRNHADFIRCHRICIVNIGYVEKLEKIQNNYWIIMKDFPEKIPVSRQYLLRLKDAI